MSLKLIVDSLEGIEESVKGLYVEKDGKFSLDVDGIEDTSGLKSALGKERKAREQFEKQAKKLQTTFETFGKTEDELLALIAKADDDDNKSAEGKGEWEKLKQQMLDRHAKDLKKVADEKDGLTKQIGDLHSAFENQMVTSQINAALAEHGGKPHLAKIIRDFIRVEKDDAGKYKVNVVDDKGEPRVNGKGNPLDISELVGEMRASEDFAYAFKGTGATGSGTPPSNGAAGRSGIKRRSDFKSEAERAAWVDANGVEKYQQLPA